MKHLLILLSILLLSSPLFGDNHKGETLYRWETSSGYVWKGFGDKDTHRVYKGEWKNGKPNGLGVMTYPDGRKYIGEFKDGKRDGTGTFLSLKGAKYIGEWKNGIYNGQGTIILGDKRSQRWVGEFKDGKRDGQGVLFYLNRKIQSGVWENDKFVNKLTIEEVDKFLKNKYPKFKGLISN